MKTLFLQRLFAVIIFAGIMYLGSMGKIFCQGNNSGDQPFYYADGEKIFLDASIEHVAVLIKSEIDMGVYVEIVRDAFSDSIWQRIDEFPRYRVVLFALLDGLSDDQKAQFDNFLQDQSEVEKITPVFTAGKEQYLMILIDEFIVQFQGDVTQDQIGAFNQQNGAEVVEQDLYEENQFILRVTPGTGRNALELANYYHENNLTLWAAPNFLREFRKMLKPNDKYFKDQWHLENTGQGSGTKGEDAEAVKAWNLTTGNENIVIAIIDDGVDYNHEDLKANIYKNPLEIPGDGKDNDKNNYKDDVRGWDFYYNDNNPIPSTFNKPYNNTDKNDIHGTPCAGVACARLNNKLGVVGICGNCKILPIKICGGKTSSNFTTDANTGKAIRYASTLADVLSNSWSGGSPSTDITNAIKYAASKGRGGKGCVILFASGNDYLSSVPYPSKRSEVIAVGASTNKAARASYSNYGAELDVIAPSSGGTRGIYTTDVSIKDRGYDDLDTKGHYTKTFGGTSSATPLVSGIAGMILSMNPTLTKAKVQEILQNTAEEIGGVTYDKNGFHKEYGYGRVNAFAAVKEAKKRRLKGVDIYARDHGGDKGDTPTSGGWWTSVDIKVDGPTDGSQTTTNYNKIKHESAISGKSNDVYVQVHNRGKTVATNLTINLYWAYAGTGLPSLPEKFWSQYPALHKDQTHWHYIGKGTINNLASGTPQYHKFASWKAPAIDPARKNPTHFCLLAIINSVQDPVFVKQCNIGLIVKNDNNITLKNINVEETKSKTSFTESFFVWNPNHEPTTMILKLDAPDAIDQEWSINLDRFGFDEPFTMEPHEQALVTMEVRITRLNQRGVVTVIQEQVDPQVVIGGITYQYGPIKATGLHTWLLILLIVIIVIVVIITTVIIRKRRRGSKS